MGGQGAQTLRLVVPPVVGRRPRLGVDAEHLDRLEALPAGDEVPEGTGHSEEERRRRGAARVRGRDGVGRERGGRGGRPGEDACAGVQDDPCRERGVHAPGRYAALHLGGQRVHLQAQHQGQRRPVVREARRSIGGDGASSASAGAEGEGQESGDGQGRGAGAGEHLRSAVRVGEVVALAPAGRAVQGTSATTPRRGRHRTPSLPPPSARGGPRT